MLWSHSTTTGSKPALVFLSIALPERYYLRDQATLSLMLGPYLPRRVESQWTSLAGCHCHLTVAPCRPISL